MVFRARDLLVRQRTQLINAPRGHLAEQGIVAAQGMAHLKAPRAALDDQGPEPPAPAREVARLYLDQIAHCAEKIAGREKSIRAQSAGATMTARSRTMPCIGPITAMASRLRPADARVSAGRRLRRLARARSAAVRDRR